MEVYAKRSLTGFIQLWGTIVIPPLLIIVYLFVIQFDVSQIDTVYWVIGVILIATSILYMVLFGSTLFLPKNVIEADDDSFHVHKRKHQDIVIPFADIIDIIAVKSARMTFLRINAVKRSYGKLSIKTRDKTYHLYPIERIDEIKKVLEHVYQSK